MHNRLTWALALLVLLAGCDAGPASESTVRVLGRVTWHGQPVRRGCVIFTADPQRNTHHDLAIGTLHFDGSYELATADGLPPQPGWYRVTLMSEDEHIVITAKFADPMFSGVSATIVGPSPQRIDLDLP